MADTKLSALTELAATPAVDDELYIRDVSEAAADESKRITISNLKTTIGKTATKVVAASDADATVKLQADYVCDGTADNVQIQAAIDAVGAGRVYCSEGTFNTTAALVLLTDYAELEIVGELRPAAGIDGIQIGDSTPTRPNGVKVTLGLLTGVGKATAGNGITVDGSSNAKVTWRKITACAKGIDITTDGGNCIENRFNGGLITDCTTGIDFTSTGTSLIQGNQFNFSIFTCNTGISTPSRGIYNQLNIFKGTVDCLGIDGSVDINDASGKENFLLDFHRPASSTFASNSIVLGVEGVTMPTFRLSDDVILNLGTTSDISMLLRSTVLNANTALTSVLIGTPVTPALAANSLIISNITADGDILIAGNDGGHSRTALFFDSSAPNTTLYNVGGTWTIGATTWTIPAVTLGGILTIATNDIVDLYKLYSKNTSILEIYCTPPAATTVFRLHTTGVTPDFTLTERLRIYGGAAEVAVSWSACNHVGIKLGGNMTVTGYSFVGALDSDTGFKKSGTQVVGARVIDARADDVVDSTYGAEEAGVLDALRDAMITHGLIAAA